MTISNMSAVKGRRGTWARRAEAQARPVPKRTQDQKRERRANGLPVLYDGDFVVHHDVAAACSPLAEQIAAAPRGTRFLRTEVEDTPGHLVGPRNPSASIDDLALAVHGVVHVVVGVLREAEASRKTQHLSADQRARARTIISTLAERPPMPEFRKADAHSGAWATALIELCEPYSAPLADLLGRAQTCVVSDRVVAALREVDAAAASLQRRLDRDAAMRADRAARPSPAPTDAEQARLELEQMGVIL